MPGKYRPVSTAEKKAEYAAKGLEWPKYPDGTDQKWHRDGACIAGGRFLGWDNVQNGRKGALARALAKKLLPGTCAFAECDKPKRQHRSGKYDPLCAQHKLDTTRRKRGWYDEGGMATIPRTRRNTQ